jgi:hypothetical protein
MTVADRPARPTPSVIVPSTCQCSLSPSGSHWWDISSARAATSLGRCRYCNEERAFQNQHVVGFRGFRDEFRRSRVEKVSPSVGVENY